MTNDKTVEEIVLKILLPNWFVKKILLLIITEKNNNIADYRA